MKKNTTLPLIFISLLCWISTAQAADFSSLLLTIPPVLAAKNTCDANHLGLCSSQATCEMAGGHWSGNTCYSGVQPVGTVISAGQVWMDRNLGASRVAMSPTDSAAYGNLYQWGRPTDGHEARTSPTTAVLSGDNVPEHGMFITTSSSPYDWRVSTNDALWQGVDGINNPCPAGFRLPTEAEWNIEILSWSSNTTAGAYASPLKLVAAGMRQYYGDVVLDGCCHWYWSSGVDGTYARGMTTSADGAIQVDSSLRAQGHSVRCIQD